MALLTSVAGGTAHRAAAVVIDFEGLPDSTAVTAQFAGQGLLFSHATVVTAGISLDQFDFPPHSGSNVVFDDGGPIVVTLTGSFTAVGGFFTYTTPLTVLAFSGPDGTGSEIGMTTSRFAQNFTSSGNPPNEFLEIAGGAPIGSIEIVGDPAGQSFTLDDLTATPEPTSLLLLLSGLAGLPIQRRLRRQR